MTLDKSVYKLGDTIKVHVEASVKGGSSDVDKITGILLSTFIHKSILYLLCSMIQESYCNLHFEKLTDQRVSIPLQ